MHFSIRLEAGRQCILVLMGATVEGKKELIVIVDGYRKSDQSLNKSPLLKEVIAGVIFEDEVMKTNAA